jgi:DNA-binding CsgD family transcriptional regulator
MVEAGKGHLGRGEWAAARGDFEAACAAETNADALDGLARALWWLDDIEQALELRARAFAQLRHEGRHSDAAAVAIWLAREHRARYRRHEVADGWLARARSLVDRLDESFSLPGWLLLAESETRPADPAGLEDADHVVALAREHGDPDLEILALMRRGACAVSGGDVRAGLSDVHEAMAAATSGEGHDVQYVAEALCGLLEVAGALGDPGIVTPWAETLVAHRSTYAFGPLVPLQTGSAGELISAFCIGCCGGVFLVTGRVDEAEEQLARAAARMVESGLRPRCLHPVADLVELRLVQGRFEEAEVLLQGFEDDPECASSAAQVNLTRNRPRRAVQRLQAALDSMGGSRVSTLPLYSQLVVAALAAGDPGLAEKSAEEVARTADLTGTPLHNAHRDRCRGLVGAAASAPDAPAHLESAARHFASAGAALLACRTRFDLARSLVASDKGRAVAEARAALQAFDRMGAATDADRCAAFLRELGVRGRTGPREIGTLTRRELQVLQLVAEGLSNPEIGERLFISTKTAGHHVSSILWKLGVCSRTEAAAYAMLHLPRAEKRGDRPALSAQEWGGK